MTGPAAAAIPGAVAALRRILLDVPVGKKLTVDDVRPQLEASSILGPAVGATFQRAIKAGWLTPTGAWKVSRNPDARGREVRVHRRNAIGPQGIGPRVTRTVDPTLLDLLPEDTR